jgi:hypothetical protein
MEVYFEYSVEFEKMSDGEYKTPKDALAAANAKWEEMCESGDYQYGRGDAMIYCLCNETGNVLMKGDYRVYSE